MCKHFVHFHQTPKINSLSLVIGNFPQFPNVLHCAFAHYTYVCKCMYDVGIFWILTNNGVLRCYWLASTLLATGCIFLRTYFIPSLKRTYPPLPFYNYLPLQDLLSTLAPNSRSSSLRLGGLGLINKQKESWPPFRAQIRSKASVPKDVTQLLGCLCLEWCFII